VVQKASKLPAIGCSHALPLLLVKDVLEPIQTHLRQIGFRPQLTMLAGPERVVKLIQRSQIPQSLCHNRSLPRDTGIVLAIANEYWARDLIEESVKRVGSQLGEPVERRCGFEGPEALIDDPAEVRRIGGVESDSVHFRVEGRRVAAFEQRYQRWGKVLFKGSLNAVHAVDGEDSSEAVFVSGDAGGEGGAEGEAHEAEAGHVDVRSRAEVVDDWGDHLVPVRSETEVLVAARRRLPRTLVRDIVPATGEYRETYRVQCVFLGGVVAATYQDRWPGLVGVGIGRAEEDCGNLESIPLDIYALTGYWQQRDGLVESCGLRVPQ